MLKGLKVYGNLFLKSYTTLVNKEPRMILMAYSSRDAAGLNVAKHVLDAGSFRRTNEIFQENPVYSAEVNGKLVRLITLREETIYAQALPEHFANLELVVFLSRHSSQSGKPTLSVHTPGNFADAEMGGLPRTVSVSPAAAMQDALKALVRLKTEMRLDYEVSYECTHHGPSLNAPTVFIELGSSPRQWNDSKAAEVVAKAALEAIFNFGVSKHEASLGIGGTHYNLKFTRMALNDEAVFGHMIPKYAIPLVDAEILRQCIERTLEKVDHVILDWKGIKSEDKPELLKMLNDARLAFQKV